MEKAFRIGCALLWVTVLSAVCRAGDSALTMATGGAAGVYYPLGEVISELVESKNPGLTVDVQTSGATAENLRLVESGNVDLAIVQNDLAHAAYIGEMPFGKGFSNLRAVARLYPEYLHVIAKGDIGVATMRDLKGKRVSVGARGSGNEANCRQIFDFYGLSYANLIPVFLPYGETAYLFKGGRIDALVLTIGTPNPVVQDLSGDQALSFIPVDGEERDLIVEKFPYFAKDRIPAGTYEGQAEPIETLSVQAMLIVNKDVSDDHVYAMLSAIFENLPELKQAHPKAGEFDVEKFANGVTIPFHPGAERYFREKGLKK